MALPQIPSGAPASQVAALIFGAGSPHADALGLTVEHFAPPLLRLRLPFQDFLTGNPESGVLHGGAISALLDTACGFIAMASLDPPRPVATLDLRIDYLRPARGGLDVLAEAEAYRITRRMVFLRACAWQEPEGKRLEVASAAGSFMITGQDAARTQGEEA